MSRKALRVATPVLREPRVLLLAEACQRLGFCQRTGEKLLAEGRFPVPHLPSIGVRRYRFSSTVIDEYLIRNGR